jgi:mono/diheme cytochrome c family protein
MLGNGCFDCHMSGYFLGKPDMARYLGGSDVGFEIPGLGVFVAPNLTPDPETGLGKWTEAQIVTALQTGKRPDGREVAPIMPWRAFAISRNRTRMRLPPSSRACRRSRIKSPVRSARTRRRRCSG